MLKVSVVIATYNGEKYLRQQLDTILEQTYPVYEILIKDDCSTDKTVSIALEYQKINSNINIVVNPENVGVWTNFLEGFFMAKGDYIAYCDQDDLWLPDRIEKMIPYLQRRNLVYCNSSVCNSNGDIVDSLRGKRQLVSEIISMFDLQVWGHQMIFKKDILYKEDVMKLSRYIYLDALLPIIAFQGNNDNVHFIDENLTIWRRHDSVYTGIYSIKSPFFKRGIWGLISSLKSSICKRKVENIKSYFEILKELNNLSENSREVVSLMSKCSLFDLIKTSFICYKDYVKFDDDLSLKERIRLLFKPFIAIDCQMKFVK